MSTTELEPITSLPQSASSLERSSPQPHDVEGESTDGGRARHELAPIDGGPAAWRLLCAAFMFEALLWGGLPAWTASNEEG